MNIRKNNGITLIALVISIIILIILAGISISGTIRGQDETEEGVQIIELNIVQHAILERNTKAQLTKESLPGTIIEKTEVQKIIEEMNSISGENINLKGTEYKQLNKEDLEKLGIIDIKVGGLPKEYSHKMNIVGIYNWVGNSEPDHQLFKKLQLIPSKDPHKLPIKHWLFSFNRNELKKLDFKIIGKDEKSSEFSQEILENKWTNWPNINTINDDILNWYLKSAENIEILIDETTK